MTSVGFTPYDGPTTVEAVEREAEDRAEAGFDEAEEHGMEAVRIHSDSDGSASALTDRDRRILEFERQWWKYAGAKEQAIRELIDMSATRYYQLLNGLIDSAAALEFDPMLVKRLRRLRATRQRARSARRLGVEF